ncbi:MAG: aminotransferase class I/II-fold pyridoxal phosphate-dependent enzyme [Planctomycetota bacterium]|jgi:cystathionine beta-lyase/cystathionine gamma-synthase|nr:aminotransferase class I/II-fold pyridoxal phosphate-dependent enzyme [Planctomycetota bacterium]MDP6988718.1 aminotransferase class I/II-fold pyridoxal phosphate-dependent enzyme [Planctomycetota bacterium]
MSSQTDYKTTTRLVHGPSHSAKWDFAHHVTPPLSSSTTYRLDDARRAARGFSEFGRQITDEGDAPVYVYDRLDEPTRSILEGELAEVEGGECCVSFASGMGAISGILGSLLVPGDGVIAHPVVYGCTHSLFTNWYPRMGIGVRRVDMNDLTAVRAAVDDRTRVFYFESPTNPTLELVDIAALRSVADELNAVRAADERIRVVIDNTFATPFCQRPLEHGADIVVHSLTKNLGGFGTELGGAVICPEELLGSLLLYRKDFGAILNSKSAWAIMVYGLPTLALRLKRQQYTAMKVAAWLEENERVRRVIYPGLESFPQAALARRQMRDFDGDFAPGNMIAFELRGGREDTELFIDELAHHAYSITLAVSLGHTKTLIELPGPMTHSSYGEQAEGPHTVRLSIGLESPGDIIGDLESALVAGCPTPS